MKLEAEEIMAAVSKEPHNTEFWQIAFIRIILLSKYLRHILAKFQNC